MLWVYEKTINNFNPLFADSATFSEVHYSTVAHKFTAKHIAKEKKFVSINFGSYTCSWWMLNFMA